MTNHPGEVIEDVVGKGRGGAALGAAGHIAPAIITAAIDLSHLVGAGGSYGIETAQLVRLAATVEILVLSTAAIERTLPELAQVGVDVAITVAGSTQGVQTIRFASFRSNLAL